MQPEIFFRKLVDVSYTCSCTVQKFPHRHRFTSKTTSSGVGVPQDTLAGHIFWVAQVVNNLQPPPPNKLVVYIGDTTYDNIISKAKVYIMNNKNVYIMNSIVTSLKCLYH